MRRGFIGESYLIMGEAPHTIAVAGTTPFSLVLAGLLAADHGRKVFVVGDRPSVHDVPPPPSFSVTPVTRPQTLQLALASGPDMLRRIGRVAPDAIERTDLLVRAGTPYHETALSHFRHLATGYGQVVEREDADGGGTILRIRDATRLSPSGLAGHVRDWAERVGIEWIENAKTFSARRNGTALLGGKDIDQLVLADDAAILAWLDASIIERMGRVRDDLAYIAERGHGVALPSLSLADGTLFDPLRDGTLAIHADNTDGLADARIAAALPQGAIVRKAARKGRTRLDTHDGAPVVGTPPRSKVYITAGLGPLDVALAPVIARHIMGEAHGFEAEWCGMRAPGREMSGSTVAEIAAGVAP